MPHFLVKQRAMYEETVFVEATSPKEARAKVAEWRDCETIESDPVSSFQITTVIREKEVDVPVIRATDIDDKTLNYAPFCCVCDCELHDSDIVLHHTSVDDHGKEEHTYTHARCEILAKAQEVLAAIKRAREVDTEVEMGEIMQDDEVFDALTGIADVLLDLAKAGHDL